MGMKILQINNFHYITGGADRIYLETARLLEQHGHEVLFFSTRHAQNEPTPYQEYFVDDVDYYDIGRVTEKVTSAVRFVYSQQAAQALRRLLKAHRPDLAHIHIFQGRLSCSILPVLKAHGIPMVFSIHEYKLLCPVYTFLDGKQAICEACQGRHYYHCVQRKCVRNNLGMSLLSAVEAYMRSRFFPVEQYGAHFIMVSRFILRKHLEYKPGLAEKASVLYNFVTPQADAQAPIVRGNYFLFFGRLVPEKGILTLLRAFVHRPELPLKLVGTGPVEDAIRAFINDHEMDHVEVLGYQTGDALAAVVRQASFTIVPSEWYESFGLTVAESMAAGTPVIASNLGALPELVQDESNGFLFQAHDAFDLSRQVGRAQALTDAQYHAMATAGREFVATTFSKQTHYQQLIQIYQQALLRDACKN